MQLSSEPDANNETKGSRCQNGTRPFFSLFCLPDASDTKACRPGKQALRAFSIFAGGKMSVSAT